MVMVAREKKTGKKVSGHQLREKKSKVEMVGNTTVICTGTV